MTVADPNRGRADLLPSIVFGLLAGALVGLAAYAVSRLSVGGANWSLSGNGALVILFSGCGMALAAGWLAIADRARGRGLQPGRVLLVALEALILELAYGFAPIILGDTASSAGAQLLLIGAFVVVALVLGVRLAGGGVRAGQIVALLALLLTLPTFGLAAVLLPLLLPLLLAVPSLSLARGPWRAANSAALLLALLAGVYLSQILTNR
jgi:hypothetical protein